MVISPQYSFIQFPSQDDCCCGVILTTSTVSDISFSVYTDFKFMIGVKSEKTEAVTSDIVLYYEFGVWVDLAVDDNDLADIFRCDECFRIVISTSKYLFEHSCVIR